MIDQRLEQRGILVSGTRTDDGVVVEITPESAGWTYIGFRAARLQPGVSHSGHTGGDEVVIVVIGGTVTVSSSAGTWEHIGERPDPFAGLPYAVYLPPQTDYEVRARSAAEVALCAAPVREAYPARLIGPEGIGVLSRGTGAASRRIHNILMDDAEAGSIFITEIQSPAGHWSSYPPHKHDQNNLPDEAQLEESYYFRIRPAQGFALQRVYTADGSLDETAVARDGDLVLVPRGYHIVAAAAEYQIYYLNVLAGPKRALRTTLDPDHAWIMQAWAQPRTLDPD
jgi:5-deoxy-glucuronate isomerase